MKSLIVLALLFSFQTEARKRKQPKPKEIERKTTSMEEIQESGDMLVHRTSILRGDGIESVHCFNHGSVTTRNGGIEVKRIAIKSKVQYEIYQREQLVAICDQIRIVYN